AKAPQLSGEPGRLVRAVVVGHADQDQQPRLLDRADYMTVYGHAGPAHPLHRCSHSTAGYPAHPGRGHTACMTIFSEHNGVNPVVAEVVRSGFTESRHRGAVAGLAADGTQVISAGEVATPFFPRSANKPLQAAAMLRAGAELDGELLAL